MDAAVEIQNPIDNFLYALRAPETRRKYPQRLKFFFDFVFSDTDDIHKQAIEFIRKAKGNDQFVYTSFLNFILAQNRRVDKKEITAGTVRNYYKAAKLFAEMNDIIINWKRIAKGLLKEKEYGEDRAPTVEELIQIMKYPDRGLKPIVLVMCSSGIRGGAWDYLLWKHIIPIKRNGEIVAAKIVVYAGEPDSYYSFITSEAYYACLDWMNFRKSQGEEISDESYIMRDLWQTTKKQRGNIGVAAYPKQLKSTGIKSLMERAIKTQGVEKILKHGTKHNTRRQLNKKIKFVPLGDITDRIDCVNRNMAKLRPDIRQIVREELENVVKQSLTKLLTDHWEEERVRRRSAAINGFQEKAAPNQG
jgi:hypothetical protein